MNQPAQHYQSQPGSNPELIDRLQQYYYKVPAQQTPASGMYPEMSPAVMHAHTDYQALRTRDNIDEY